MSGARCGSRGRQACRTRAARGSTWRSLRTSRQELADGRRKLRRRKRGPGSEKSRSRAPRGAPLRSQGEAARSRRACRVTSPVTQGPDRKGPAFLGAPLPSWERKQCAYERALLVRRHLDYPADLGGPLPHR